MKFNLIILVVIGFFCLNVLANTVEVKHNVNGNPHSTHIRLLKGSLLLCRQSERQINEELSDSEPIRIVNYAGLNYTQYFIEKPILSVSSPIVFNGKLCVVVNK